MWHLGYLLIDNLIYNLSLLNSDTTREEYILLTLHRPSNTDIKQNLTSVLEGIDEISKTIKVVFPTHPRTMKQIKVFGLTKLLKNIDYCDPLSYLEFLKAMRDAHMVLTDSGGVQPEAYYLGVPCITLRTTTEHTFTLKAGANVLVGSDKHKLLKEFNKLYNGTRSFITKNILYDGKAAERIVKILMEEVK